MATDKLTIRVLLCSCILLWQCAAAHYTQQWALHIPGGKEVADQVARDHGFENLGEIFHNYYHFSHRGVAKRSLSPHRKYRERLAVDLRVDWAEQQKAKSRRKRAYQPQNSDPKWNSMWYLNRGGGLDMNVLPVWKENINGKNVVVTILDDGVETDHPDLITNYDRLASYDVNDMDDDPSPRYDKDLTNKHGTRCAGEVAATRNNSICGLGVAFGASIGGVRMLDGDVTDAVEARSLSFNSQYIDIYSASWGPDDDGKTVDGPGLMATRAFIDGIKYGRNMKGSIFVWASGNGGREFDNCNCDGYTNSIYSLSISSATEQGQVPWYSERCSSTLATTYSSGSDRDKQIVTTDLNHKCTTSHTGTSASAPMAAGICALALQANPNLTWRDMQHIVIRTARPENLYAKDWQRNGVGRNVSHSFGYGLMDAYGMVQLAKKWITVPKQNVCTIKAPHRNNRILPSSTEIFKVNVTACEGVEVLEHVQATISIDIQSRADLHIRLISPMGTEATLLTHRAHDKFCGSFKSWPFMSVFSWGETPFGVWELEIHNSGSLFGRATLHNWSLILYGTKQLANDIALNTANKTKCNNKNNAKKTKNNKKKKPIAKSTAKPAITNSTLIYLIPRNDTNRRIKNKGQKNKLELTTPVPFNAIVVTSKKSQVPVKNMETLTKLESTSKRPIVFDKYPNAEQIYPAVFTHDTNKMREQSKKSHSQKQNENSRDLNSNRNNLKNSPELTTVRDVTMLTKDAHAGKI